MKKNLLDVPQNMSIGFYEGSCNLQCPKCLVSGKGKGPNKSIKGTMPFEKVCKLLDELKGSDVVVAGSGYTEPLLQKDFWKYLKAIKDRGLKVSINTNGTLLTEEYAKRFMDLKIDCVFVSIDAITKDTLKKVRGTDELDKINEAVFVMLKARKDKPYPRIGVSFIAEEANLHEKEGFITFWIQHVDAIRVAEVYSEGNSVRHKVIPENRKPCPMLYDNMLIHNTGDVSLCCWDANGRTNVGNVFKQGIKGVWLGEEFQKIRHYHETGQFDKVPFCKNCNDWPRDDVTTEETVDNILIRRSPLLTYYNRIDRLFTWSFDLGKSIKLG